MNRAERREAAYQAAVAAHRALIAARAELVHAMEGLLAECVLWAAEHVAERVNRRRD